MTEPGGNRSFRGVGTFVRDSVNHIKKKVRDSKAVVGVSGGVDSTVAALLVHKAIGENLKLIMIDNGLMREGEPEFVASSFSRLGIALKVVNAKTRFLEKLLGVTDPERKRKIIGQEFIRVFEEEAAKFFDVRFLVQGTIRSDVVESGALSSEGEKAALLVKSHHNVGGLPKNMKLKLLEPLRDLHKDEVKLVGKELGLPGSLIHRHPFPGPGLAVRVLGEVTENKLKILRKAQSILEREISKTGWYDKLWQCFCVLPNVRTVGVKEGKRTYGHLVAIRAVLSTDAMTAQWAQFPKELLSLLVTKITEEVPEVNRVVYDVTPKPPGTIEWE